MRNVRRTFSRSRHRGFTLFELVLVMLLITVLLGISLPSVRGFLGNSRARDAVNQIIAVSQWARAKSASEARVYRLGFDAMGYRLSVQEGETFAPVGSDFGRPFALPAGMRVEVVAAGSGEGVSEPGTIAFYPDGRTEAGIVRLTEADGRVTLIACLAPTEPLRVVTPEEAASL